MKIALAAMAALMLASPALAAPAGPDLNPFAGMDNGFIVTAHGDIIPAAIPAVTVANEQAIFRRLGTVHKYDDTDFVVGQCGGGDVPYPAEVFAYHGRVALVTFCGRPLPQDIGG